MIKKLSILAVDDEEEVHQRISEIARKLKADRSGPEGIDLKVYPATSKRAAQTLIDKSFFHLALVDLHLSPNARSRADGCDVLEYLRINRPSCRRVAMTDKTDRDQPDTATKEIFYVTNPSRPLCEGIINKASNFDVLGATIAKLTDELSNGPVVWRASDLAAIYRHVRAKVSAATSSGVGPASSKLEVEAVMTALFGRAERRLVFAQPRASEPPFALREIAEEFRRREARVASFSSAGRSRSVVFFMRTELVRDLPGPVVVVKVAGREDVVEEGRRYNMFMRYGARHAARPDLLGLAVGDSIGALAYSFGGLDEKGLSGLRVPTDVESLVAATLDPTAEAPLRESCRARAYHAMEDVLGPQSAYWYRRSFDVPYSMLDLVASSFGIDIDLGVDAMVDTASALGSVSGVSYGLSRDRSGRPDTFAVPGRLTITGDRVLPLPSRAFFSKHAAGKGHAYSSCIVHGDLNLSNLLVHDNKPEVMVIDFRHTGIGPRLYDFAALGVHFRLLEAELTEKPGATVSDDIGALKRAVRAERMSWGSGPLHPEQAARLSESAQFSRQLLSVARRTFEVPEDRIRAFTAELQFCTALYCLRLLAIASVSPTRRARLIVVVSVIFDFFLNPG